MFTAAVACSVRARLDSKEGISFTEFTYQLLQAYDFQELHRSLGCTIQVGGSDQWGNILAGVDLINRIADSEQGPQVRDKVYGVTTPLLTNSSGLKFSKSTGTAVWLDRSLSSYQDFYQVPVSHDILILCYRLTPAVLYQVPRRTGRGVAQDVHPVGARTDCWTDGTPQGTE